MQHTAQAINEHNRPDGQEFCLLGQFAPPVETFSLQPSDYPLHGSILAGRQQFGAQYHFWREGQIQFLQGGQVDQAPAVAVLGQG